MAAEAKPLEDIIIPSYYGDLAGSVKLHYRDYQALDRSIEIGKDLDVDNDALDDLEVRRDQVYEIAWAMAKVLDMVPNCESPGTKGPKCVAPSELIDGRCAKCGAIIIVEASR